MKTPITYSTKYGQICETEIVSAVHSKNKIQLIKWYREITDAGLKDSKDAVESVYNPAFNLGNPNPTSQDMVSGMLQLFQTAAIKAGLYVPPKADNAFVIGLLTEAMEHYAAMQYNSYEDFLEDYLRNVKKKGGFEELAKQRWLFEHGL